MLRAPGAHAAGGVRARVRGAGGRLLPAGAGRGRRPYAAHASGPRAAAAPERLGA